MYVVVFGWDRTDQGRPVIIPAFDKAGKMEILGRAKTLDEARSLRRASGDLVFDEETREIVRDETWLWESEKKDPRCYAQRNIKSGARLGALNDFNRLC